VSTTELDEARQAAGVGPEDPWPPEGENGSSSIAARAAAMAANGGEFGGEQEEMFPMGAVQGDHKVTMKTIAPSNTSRKTEAKMRATAIPLRDGLVRYGELVELLVTVEAGKVEEKPDLEEPEAGGRRKLLGLKDVQHFRPVYVTSARGMFTREQVLDILNEVGVPPTADVIPRLLGDTQE
jgi:hypothetical protein